MEIWAYPRRLALLRSKQGHRGASPQHHQPGPGADRAGGGRRLSLLSHLTELAGPSKAMGTIGQLPDPEEGPAHRHWENRGEEKGGSERSDGKEGKKSKGYLFC